APTVASRFLLRFQAVSADKADQDASVLAMARALDQRLPEVRITQPAPDPSADQRKVNLSVTELDRLRADPFAFYARRILGLTALDPVDAEPSAAWRGTAVHSILEKWRKEDGLDPELLARRAERYLDEANVHPLITALWRPRLLAALQWVACCTGEMAAAGRQVVAAEIKGSMVVDGITITGKADRIDRMPDGSLVIVDYKTGQPPSSAQVEAGYALQLGLLGMIAQRSGYKDHTDTPGPSGIASGFEYWSLTKHAKSETGFGHIATPVKSGRKTSGLAAEAMMPTAERYLREALAEWILGRQPFTAKLVPDQAIFTEYDQLMRLGEWYGRQRGSAS
uniref:PD-(D/E)XK nuclease family protein n=1 Tax=Blastomonas sp. TaxID=1909299 RepID=UPI003593119C